ncbi:MAG: ATP-binding protein [Vicinamibacteria bacterium]
MQKIPDPGPPRGGDRLDLVLPMAAAALVFGADLLAPGGASVAVLHVAVVVAAAQLERRRHLVVAVVCTLFTVAALLSPTAPVSGSAVLGRVLVAAAIWTVAGILRGRERVAGGGERTFRALLEAAPDAMVIVDSRGEIVLVNSQTERLFGYDRRELLGRPVEILIPDALRARHHAHRYDYSREPRLRTMGEGLELAALRKDGSTFPVDIALGPLAGDDGPLVSAAIRDVTERKRTERAMRDFLATLGHELRNPMAAMSNATRLLSHPKASREQAHWSLSILEAEGRHMTRLIDDLLDLSRVARNTIQLKRETVELSAVIDRVLSSTRVTVEQRGQTITVSLPRGRLALDADPVRLAQVFSNLVDNAAKYGTTGNRIEVEARRDAGMLVVAVRDQGQGIGAESLPRIFDMFYRTDRSLEQQEGGLGIGLTLVRQLVELHGGSVEAASEGVGRGSTFEVRLPLLDEPPPASADESSSSVAGSGHRRVLVVDDNRRAADSLAEILRLDGHEVETAYDGRQALAAVDRFRPQVALLDIGMPEVNGYDVARRVRAEPWGAGLFLVALTGLGTPEDRARAQEAGFDTHLVKPVDVDALERILAEVAPP